MHMKRFAGAVIFALCGIVQMYAQKYALIDMEYITKNIPEYQQKQAQIEADTKKYQAEVEALGKQAKTLYENYQKSASKLTQAQRTARETEIVNKEKQMKDLGQKYFGQQGVIAQAHQDLMQPLQRKVYEAVKAISEAQGYTMVIDRASDNSIIFASPSIDISDAVLRKMGYTPTNR